MPIHYVTIKAKRVKGPDGKWRFEETERIIGPEVPDMTEDEYFEELARLLWPMIKPKLMASKNKEFEKEWQRWRK